MMCHPVDVLYFVAGNGISGRLELRQGTYLSPLRISGSIRGLSAGPHGFHIHAEGSTADGCKAAGGHYNPTNVS